MFVNIDGGAINTDQVNYIGQLGYSVDVRLTGGSNVEIPNCHVQDVLDLIEAERVRILRVNEMLAEPIVPPIDPHKEETARQVLARRGVGNGIGGGAEVVAPVPD
jgi:hypothetical protein